MLCLSIPNGLNSVLLNTDDFFNRCVTVVGGRKAIPSAAHPRSLAPFLNLRLNYETSEISQGHSKKRMVR
jgi:hypothetical protein